MAGEDRWADASARTDWVRDHVSQPENLQRKSVDADWARYQQAHAGDYEVALTTPAGDRIWADGLVLDADSHAVAVEVKFIEQPGTGKSLYEGGRPDYLMSGFDREMQRYREVVADPANPVSQLRLVASTDKAAEFLGNRARGILGEDVDLDVRVEPTAPGTAPTASVSPAPPSADLAPARSTAADATEAVAPAPPVQATMTLAHIRTRMVEIDARLFGSDELSGDELTAIMNEQTEMLKVLSTPNRLAAAEAAANPDPGETPDVAVEQPAPAPTEPMSEAARAADPNTRMFPNAHEAVGRTPRSQRAPSSRPRPAPSKGKSLKPPRPGRRG